MLKSRKQAIPSRLGMVPEAKHVILDCLGMVHERKQVIP